VTYRIPESDDALLADCTVETFRSGGPGGQHANKVESAVRLTHLPTGETVTRRETRSQHRNKKLALEELRARLEARARPKKKRRATAPSAASKRRRLDAKRQRAETKRHRRPPEA
jgi:ribosome-associated protein